MWDFWHGGEDGALNQVYCCKFRDGRTTKSDKQLTNQYLINQSGDNLSRPAITVKRKVMQSQIKK